MAMHCIVLAGGLGTRLNPITKHKPKPLVLYKGIPLVSRIIQSMYPFCDNVTVVTKHMHEQFADLPYSFHKCQLSYSNTDNMAAAFLGVCKSIREEFIVGVSSDIVYENDLVVDAFGHWTADDTVHVLLTKSGKQTYKKWSWDIKDEKLVDLRVEDNPTGYEKLFIIFPRHIIEKYTCGYTDNMATIETEFNGHESYNHGWIYLIHRMLGAGISIKAIVLEGGIINVNSIEDLQAI